MTETREPGEPRPRLDRPPGERYPTPVEVAPGTAERWRAPLLVAAVGVVLYVLLGGLLAVTTGLVALAAVVGWLIGLTLGPPRRALLLAVVTVVLGLVGIWLFGRWEGGVLGPIDYLAEVQGALVPIELLVAGGLAAAASK